MIVSTSSGYRHKVQLEIFRIILQSNALQQRNPYWRQPQCAESVSIGQNGNPQCRIISSTVGQRRIIPNGKLL